MSNQQYVLPLSGRSALTKNLRLRNVGSARYGGDWLSIPHTHNYTELFYIMGGDGKFQIDDALFPVSAHQLVVVNPNVSHTEVSHDSHPLEYIVVGVEGLELKEGHDSRFSIFSFPESNDILPCMQSILTELRERGADHEAVCQAYMEILIIRLNRQAVFSPVSPPEKPNLNRQCVAVRRYIDAHYKEELTLERLAGEANLNKYYLAHAFKLEFGVSPISYMNACRVTESKRLLVETDWSLIQIAAMLGYSSPSYFSQSFRRAEGISPQAYRKSHKR